MAKKTVRQQQSEAAFGPKIRRGKVDPDSPGARLAQFPVEHEKGMKRAVTVLAAVTPLKAGSIPGQLPRTTMDDRAFRIVTEAAGQAYAYATAKVVGKLREQKKKKGK